MSINDSVDWALDLGGGVRVALIQAGSFRSDAGALFGPVPRILWNRFVTDEIDDDHRLLQALNCLLVETPAGRVLVETGIGERVSDKVRAMRGYEGTPIVPALREAGFDPASVDVVAMSHLHFDHAGGLLLADGARAFPRATIVPALREGGFDPASVDVVAMSHLHFDHAGGLLLADGTRAFPRATIVAQRSEWEIALGDNPRLVASYDQPEIRLVREWGAEAAADGERELLPGVSVVPTGGHSAGHQAILVRGTGDNPRTVAFFGDLCMRPWAANPRWVTSFDDFPLDSVAVKASLFGRAADEGWTVVLSHESVTPIGRLVTDRDRFAFESR